MPQPQIRPANGFFRVVTGPETIHALTLTEIPVSGRMTARVVLDASLSGGAGAGTPFGVDVAHVVVFRTIQEVIIPDEDELPPGVEPEPQIEEQKDEVRRSDGVTPVEVGTGEFAEVAVRLTRVPVGFGRATGTLHVEADTWDPIAAPLTFTEGTVVEASVNPREFRLEQGASAAIELLVRWISGPAAELRVLLRSGESAIRIHLDETAFRIEPGTTTTVPLILRAEDDAELGLRVPELFVQFVADMAPMGGLHGSSRVLGDLTFRCTVVKPPPVLPDPVTIATAEIREFHKSSLGVLVVGSPVGPTRQLPNGSFEQRYEFGSIIKPPDGPPAVAQRFVVTIDIAAIKCFGTDDPSGTDEPYIVLAAYGIDPLVRERAVQTSEIHFGPVDEKAIFAQGHPLTSSPIFIPGDGKIQLVISLWEEEQARPVILREKWQEAATAAMLAGLTALNPVVGGTAAALETAKGVVSDAARELITMVSDFLGLSDDHLATREFSITADFLKRLIADGSGLPRTSPSIPGIRYNFPELPETPDATGRSWFFEGGGGSYRIFLTVRTATVNLTPSL